MSNLNHACVRILIDDQSPRSPKGAGFLIAPNLVITCAHVVAEVLKIAETTAEKPTQTLFLDFPFVEQQPLQTAIVEAWYPVKNQPRMADIEDLALLRLTENVTTLPFTLVDLPVYLNRAVHLTGFPKTKDEGIYLQGYLREITGEGRVQIDTEQGRGSVVGGFSGSAVYDMQENGVVGIVVSIDTYGGDVRGYMIPATTLLKAFPQLDELSRSLNPYKNLFAFTEDDVEFFFGREQATEELYAEINHKPFITVLGASGSGKSSLVLAGLIPRLKQQHWQILSLRLKREPFKNLALTLIPFLEADKITQAKKLDELSQDLETHKVKLSNLLSLAVKPPCLLFIDQFEELFTNNDTQTQQRFLSCLLELLTTSPTNIKVLITLRADFMGQSLAFDNLAHVLKQNPPYLLTAMQQNELTAAISKPAAKLGVQFEKGLVAQLLREVGTEAGRLPLLQFTLTKLWEKQTHHQISFEAYQQLGGLEKSLVQYADEVWQSFQHDEKQQARLRYALVQLVRPGLGTEDTRQVALRSDMEQNWDLMQALADKRLVVTGGDETSQTVEIVHEVLIKHWGRMQEWLREDRAFRLWQNNLRVAIKEWERTNKDNNELLGGVRLVEAEEKLALEQKRLTTSESEFIQKSLQHRDVKARNKRFLVGVALTVLIGASLVITGLYFRAEKQRKQAFENLIPRALWLADKSQELLEKEDAVTAMLLALEALPKQITNPSRPYTHQAYSSLYNAFIKQKEYFYQSRESSDVEKAIYSPDGNKILVILGTGNTYLVDKKNREKLLPYYEFGDVDSADFSPDSKKILTVPWSGGIIKVWDLQGQEIISFDTKNKEINTAKFDSTGTRILIASDDTTAQLWDLTGHKLVTFKGHKGKVFTAVFHPSNNTILTSSQDKTAKLWDLSGKYITTFSGHQESVLSAEFNSSGDKILTASVDNTAKLWDLSGNELVTFKGHEDSVTNAVFNFIGDKVLTVSMDRSAKLWDLKAHELLTIKEHNKEVSNAVFNPKSDEILISSVSGAIELWNLNTPKFIEFQAHNESVLDVAFSFNGEKFLTASKDKTINVWETSTHSKLLTLKGHQSAVNSAVFNFKGDKILTASQDKTAIVWDANTGRKLLVLEGHKDEVFNAVFNSKGDKVLTCSEDRTAILWDSSNGRKLLTIKFEDGVESAIFAPSKDEILTFSHLNSVAQLWDFNGKEILKTDSYQPYIFSTDRNNNATFNKKGDRILTASHCELNTWNLNGDNLSTFKNCDKEMTKASFNNEGDNILTVSAKSIDIRNLNGKILISLKYHKSQVNGAVLSPDEKTILSSSTDGSVKLWAYPENPQKLIDLAQKSITRQLTDEQKKEFFLKADN